MSKSFILRSYGEKSKSRKVQKLLLEELQNIVVRHIDHKKDQKGQTDLLENPPLFEAERSSGNPFKDQEKDVAAVEDGNR